MKVFAETSKKASPIPSNMELGTSQVNPNSHSYKTLILILFCSLTFGMIWQIYSFLYLNQSDVVKLHTKFGETYKKIPALTFCTNIGTLTSGKTSSEVFNKINPKDVVGYIQLSSIYGKDDENYTFLMDHTIETISYKYYCFTINSALKVHPLEVTSSQQLWIRLKKFGIYNSWWISMHNSYDVPSSYQWNAIEVKQGFYVPITYDHKSYEQAIHGNCLNYLEQTKYNSHSDCLRKCALSTSIERCGVVYNGIDVSKEGQDVRFVGSKLEKLCATNMIEFGNECHGRCPHMDCHIDTYTPKLIEKYHNHKNYTTVQLIAPNEPELIYMQEQAISLKQFFFSICFSLSLWLGFVFFFIEKRLKRGSVQKTIEQSYDKIFNFKDKNVEQAKTPM